MNGKTGRPVSDDAYPPASTRAISSSERAPFADISSALPPLLTACRLLIPIFIDVNTVMSSLIVENRSKVGHSLDRNDSAISTSATSPKSNR